MDKQNIVLIGMPGCGKSTIGRKIAIKIGYKFIDMDNLIENKFEKIEKLFEYGEDYFRQKETIIAKEISLLKKQVIATGGGIIIRKENMKALSKSGIIIFIDRKINDIMDDIRHDLRPLLKDDKTKLNKLYEKRYHLYKEYADIIIKNEGKLFKVIDKILYSIKEKV